MNENIQLFSRSRSRRLLHFCQKSCSHSSIEGGEALNQNCSEVARLMQQIAAEYEAAARGLTGLAYGVANHAFITARQENIAMYVQELRGQVGDQQAFALLSDLQASSSEAEREHADVEKGTRG